MARLRRSLGLFVLGSVALALGGCPSSTNASVPIEMLGQLYGEATCGVLVDCYGEAIVSVFTGTPNQMACEANAARGYVNAALPRYQAAITAGTLSYDGTQAHACLDAITAEGCSALSARTPPACDLLFVGHVAAGGACSIDEECVGDAYCAADTACPGTCQALAGSGGACTRDQGCQSGLRCGGGTCMAPGGAGASCQGSTGVECMGGLICRGAMGTTAGTCTPVATVLAAGTGQACDLQNSQLCQEGLSCIISSLTSQTCGAAGVPDGGTCHPSVPTMCASGSFCDGTNPMAGDFDGVCAPLPGAGLRCAAVLVGPTCAAGSVCQAGDCVAVQENGGACTANGGCYSNLCASNVCAAPMLCN